MANISSSYSLHSEAVNFVRFVTFTKHFLDNSVKKICSSLLGISTVNFLFSHKTKKYLIRQSFL